MSPGLQPPPRPGDPGQPTATDVPGLPDEEHLDPARVEEDLAEEPEEKHNATDGYSPADDPDTSSGT